MATNSSKSSAEKVQTEPEQVIPDQAPEHPAESPGPTANPTPEPATVAKIDARAELTALEKQFKRLGFKHSTPLVTFENNLNRARKFIDSADEVLLKQAESIRAELKEKFARNAEHQDQLKQQSETLLAALEKALTAGQSQQALSTWDKLQSNLNNTTGEIKKTLQESMAPFKAKIKELRDWKIFAATEKKKELIEQMAHLAESRMHAADRSKHINKLHKDWKTLGRSNQNDELWNQFKQASDKASELCKDYFKQRKLQLTTNFKARQKLCEELEDNLKEEAKQLLNLPEINKLLKQADESWKKHAPVDHGKIKPLQKRYYASVNELRKLRKTLVKQSAQAKLQLIDRASALLDLEDQQQSMAEAKKLQSEWKQVGPGSYKDDKHYWEKFRKICDQIFAVKNKEKAKRESSAEESRKQLQTHLQEMEQLLLLVDDELREKRKHYQQMQQSFSGALEQMPPKQRGRFRDQFNGLKRKLDTRYKSLPDKKTQALLDKIQDCSDYLEKFESRLLAADVDLAEMNKSFDRETWEEKIDGIAKDQLALLQKRADTILKCTESAEAANAVSETDEALRELCIEAEIRANADSPKQDQEKRMELQLAQLKHGFGRAQQSNGDNAKFIQQSRLKLLCLGPIPAPDRANYADRLEKSLQRLF